MLTGIDTKGKRNGCPPSYYNRGIKNAHKVLENRTVADSDCINITETLLYDDSKGDDN